MSNNEYFYIDIDIEDTKDINNEMVDYVPKTLYEKDILPENVSISTMSITAFLGTTLYTKEIEKYMELDNDNIIAIKSSKNINRLEIYVYKFKSTNKNSTRNFYNQITTIIKIENDRFMNV